MENVKRLNILEQRLASLNDEYDQLLKIGVTNKVMDDLERLLASILSTRHAIKIHQQLMD